jgi:hypothetical protein
VKTKAIISVIGLALIVVGSAYAQTIKGLTGKDVPDLGALRLILNSRSRGGVMHGISDIGLNAADTVVFTQAMQTWRLNYDVARIDPDQASKWGRAHSATQEALVYLQSNLSPAGLEKFTIYLQARKRLMSLSKIDVSLPASVRQRNLDESQMVASHMSMNVPEPSYWGGMTGEMAEMPGMAMPQGQTMTENYSMYNDVYVDGNYAVSDELTTPGSLNSNWTVNSGSFAETSTGVSASGYPSSASFTNGTWVDQNGCALAFLAALPSIDEAIGISARVTPTSSIVAFWYEATGRRWSVRLSKYGGSFSGGTTILGYGTPAVGDILQLCTEGPTVTANVFTANGTYTMSTTDTSPVAGYFGLYGNGNPVGTLSNFYAGNEPPLVVITQLSGDTVCSLGCPGGAFHTPNITNTNGTVGGQEFGNSVSPQTQIDFFNNQTYLWQGEGGNDNPIQTTGQVVCTVVGVIYPGLASIFSQEVAVTMGTFGHLTTNYYPTSPWCSLRSSPPDWNPNAYTRIPESPQNDPPELPAWATYWKSKTYCALLLSIKLSCLVSPTSPGPNIMPLAKFETVKQAQANAQLYGDGNQFDCTNASKGINTTGNGHWDDPPVH